jgi:hypothetical protein
MLFPCSFCLENFRFACLDTHRKLCDVVGYVEQRSSAPLVFRGDGGVYST